MSAPADPVRVYAGPESAWTTIWDTIALDAQSKAFTADLREEISRAERSIHLVDEPQVVRTAAETLLRVLPPEFWIDRALTADALMAGALDAGISPQQMHVAITTFLHKMRVAQ